MRIALLIVVLASLAFGGCGKKKAPQSPAASESQQMKQDSEEKEVNAPAEGDEDSKDTRSSDPQEGGE
jgi:hypothetical protein